MKKSHLSLLFILLFFVGCQINPSSSSDSLNDLSGENNIVDSTSNNDTTSTDSSSQETTVENIDSSSQSSDHEDDVTSDSTSDIEASESEDGADTTIDSDSSVLEAESDLPLPIQSIETEQTLDTYHDQIFDLRGVRLNIDLTDVRLQELKSYLSVQDVNFTLHEIGKISVPESIYVMCNKLNQLSDQYIPENLRKVNIPFTFEGESEKKQLRDEAASAIEQLFEAASKENVILYGLSGYRSYTTQIGNYTSRVESRGQEEADKISARPGHSEHQTGLAMDVTSASVNYKLVSEFGESAEGIWLKENAHKFGFIIRYMKDKTNITGYSYEPWHCRYVGVDVASYLYENNIVLEELYSNLLNK